MFTEERLRTVFMQYVKENKFHRATILFGYHNYINIDGFLQVLNLENPEAVEFLKSLQRNCRHFKTSVKPALEYAFKKRNYPLVMALSKISIDEDLTFMLCKFLPEKFELAENTYLELIKLPQFRNQDALKILSEKVPDNGRMYMAICSL